MKINVRILPIAKTAVATSSILLAQSAFAQEFIKGGEERFVLNLGGIVNQFDSNVRLDGTAGRGTEIDLEGNGLKRNLSSFVVNGTWRIADRHRTDFTYFKVNRSGNRSYANDITIGDNVIAAGATVSAETKADFFWLDYRYSFLKSNEWELAGLFGVYGGTFKTSVSGARKGGGGATVSSSASTTLPLPLLGVSGDWYISPRWKAFGTLAGMAVEINGIEGNAGYFTLGTEYMITRNWGLGATWQYTKIGANANKSGFNGEFNWNANSALLYATAKF